MIKWQRLAEPQADGYDAFYWRALAEQVWPPSERELPAQEGLFLDTIPLRRLPFVPSGGHALPQDYANDIIQKAQGCLRAWPRMAEQCQALIGGIYPVLDKNFPEGTQGPAGCSCGRVDYWWGHVWATCFDVLGFAEGIVHELGHWKLFAAGVRLESWDDRLIANSPKELLASPIRKDMPRPMGAVLHAQYSYLHVLELQLHALREDAVPWRHYRSTLATNLTRMEEGEATLAKHWRPSPGSGEAFRDGIVQWQHRLLPEVRAFLEEKGA